MENKNSKLDELIRASMEIKDTPPPELNSRLKACLYQREAEIRRENPVQVIRLWYVPMILNFITFSLLAVFALLVISNPYLAKLAAICCGYMSIAGFLITAVGIKRTNMKREIAIHIRKRGVAA